MTKNKMIKSNVNYRIIFNLFYLSIYILNKKLLNISFYISLKNI